MSGNLRFMLVNHREKQHPCIRDYDAEVSGLSKPIGLSELESAFLLLLLGTAASSMLLPVEFAATWARTRRRAGKLRLHPNDVPSPDIVDISWLTRDGGKARPVISLRHGWKQAKRSRWTTVGPGGHVLTDCYPSFGQFGRRPLYVREAPLFPAYDPSWGRDVLPAADEPLGRRLAPHRGHIVTVGGWP